MPPIRYRDPHSSNAPLFVAIGALAGLAAGVLIAQRVGGVSALASRVRERFGRVGDEDERERGLDASDFEQDDFESPDEELEERVLEAFRNDPVLSERAVDIGAIGTGIIELSGWVHTEDETQHAVTLTRGVPDVVTVVNRLAVRQEEERMDESTRRYEEGDDSLTEGQWEGGGVGTGRRRQGTSAEMDRHADPKPNLEDRWQTEEQALRAAADDLEGLAERRKKGKPEPQADRTGGGPVAPSGVPKSDHVADPSSANDLLREETGRNPNLPSNKQDAMRAD